MHKRQQLKNLKPERVSVLKRLISPSKQSQETLNAARNLKMVPSRDAIMKKYNIKGRGQ